MSLNVNVNNRLDLPICQECYTSEITVEHEVVCVYGDLSLAVEITVDCEHREACKRACLMSEQTQELDV